MLQFFAAVGHHHRQAGKLQHFFVVPVVADGHHLRAVKAAPGGPAGQGCSLVATGVQHVQQSQVSFEILSHGQAGVRGAGATAEMLRQRAHRSDRAGEEHLNGVAVGQGFFQAVHL